MRCIFIMLISRQTCQHNPYNRMRPANCHINQLATRERGHILRNVTICRGVSQIRKARFMSAAVRRNCRQLATQECSDRPKRRSIAAFEQLVVIKRKRAHVSRDQTYVDANALVSLCIERQLVATGRKSRTCATWSNSTPTRRRSVAVLRQSAHVASDPATDRSQPVAASCR